MASRLLRIKEKGKEKKDKEATPEYDTGRFLSKSHEQYFHAVVVQQSMIRERGIDIRSPEFAAIREKGWMLACMKEGSFSPELTQEFYANAVEFEGKGRTPYASYVRGHEITFSKRFINAIWHNPLTHNPRAKCKFQQLCKKKPSRVDIWNVLATRRAYWVESEEKEPTKMKTKDLNPTAKMWCTFVSHSLLPTGNRSEVDSKRAWLIMALMQGKFVDFGEIVADHIEKIAAGTRNLSFSLAYPILITELCRRATVDFSAVRLHEPLPPILSQATHEELQAQSQQICPSTSKLQHVAAEQETQQLHAARGRYSDKEFQRYCEFNEARAVQFAGILQAQIEDARRPRREGKVAALPNVSEEYLCPYPHPFYAPLPEVATQSTPRKPR